MCPDTIPAHQYYLSEVAPDTIPPGYTLRQLDGWCLCLDADFTILPVVAGGNQVGIVFGTILDIAGTTTDGVVRLDTDGSGDELLSRFESALRHLFGRYVGIVIVNGESRVYPDAAGTIPVFYDAQDGIVAASPMAMPEVDHTSRFRESLFDALKRPLVSRGENIWVPGELTYYSGISQLLPNHYLDLDTLEATRFWPENNELTGASNSSAEIETIIDTLDRIFAAVVDCYENPTMGLTAGKDSRSLVATARKWVTNRDISIFTLGENDRDVDRHVAKRLTRKHGLKWTPLPITEASAAEQRHWLKRTGYTVGSGIKETYPSMHALDTDAEIGGIGGEIGRGYLWKESDDRDTHIGPSDLLFRWHKPEHPELVTALEQWLEGVEQFDTYTTLDLAHQEHRLGCWGGPQHLGFRAEVDHIRPFLYRPIVESAYRLGPDIQRTDGLPLQIVERRWPELAEFPYNSFTDWKKFWAPIEDNAATIKSAVIHPDTALDYLTRKYRFS